MDDGIQQVLLFASIANGGIAGGAECASARTSRRRSAKQRSPTGHKVLLEHTEDRADGPVEGQASREIPGKKDGDERHDEGHHLHRLCQHIFLLPRSVLDASLRHAQLDKSGQTSQDWQDMAGVKMGQGNDPMRIHKGEPAQVKAGHTRKCGEERIDVL